MDLERLISQSMSGFEKIAKKQKHQLVRWHEESQFALQAVQNSVRLQECEFQTIQDAIINVAAVGLTLNPAHGYAYLIPDTVKIDNDNWRKVCQLRVSFKGLIKLANDSGVAKWVKADVVKKNDTFTFNGAWNLPTHEMEPFSDRGPSVGVYCTIKTHDGEYLTETAPWSEVLKARTAAKTDYVWKTWEDEMAKKFIIKRASKQWPKSNGHLAEAITVIDRYEGSEDLDRVEKIAAEILGFLYSPDYTDPEKSSLLDESYHALPESDKSMLWTAITKGGWLTQDDKAEIRRLSHPGAEEQST